MSQGGDWGSVVADAMARQAPPGLLGIHVNMPATVPPDVAKALKDGDPAPAGLSDKEKAAFKSLNDLYTKGAGYAGIMVTRPQTLGYGLSDSPAGLAAFFYDKFNDWTYSGGNAEKVLTRDEMLDDITLYWLTNTGTSSARLYWENNNNNFNVVEQKHEPPGSFRSRFKYRATAGFESIASHYPTYSRTKFGALSRGSKHKFSPGKTPSR